MGLVGQQFGKPSGVLGGLAGRFMAKNNAVLNQWVAAQAIDVAQPDRILEIGSGPGIGTAALLDAVPAATLTAVDPSPRMVRQLARRNREAAAAWMRDCLGSGGHAASSSLFRLCRTWMLSRGEAPQRRGRVR